MSLKDTIKGAREEAMANSQALGRGSSEMNDESSSQGSDQGYVRRSASRAKPKRKAAAGVRVVSGSGKTKSESEMSKEERKSERKKQREKEDRRYAVSQMLLEDDAEYQHHHKIWWRILIVGFVFMLIALVMYGLVSQAGDTAPMWQAVLSMVSMVIAYVSVIVSFIYDWRHIRPIRRSNETRAASMSEKRINKTLREREKKEQK